MFNAKLANEAQTKYCKDKNLPHFAPTDGVCWRCRRNIYEENGIKVEDAGKYLITGCPHCHISYCE